MAGKDFDKDKSVLKNKNFFIEIKFKDVEDKEYEEKEKLWLTKKISFMKMLKDKLIQTS